MTVLTEVDDQPSNAYLPAFLCLSSTPVTLVSGLADPSASLEHFISLRNFFALLGDFVGSSFCFSSPESGSSVLDGEISQAWKEHHALTVNYLLSLVEEVVFIKGKADLWSFWRCGQVYQG